MTIESIEKSSPSGWKEMEGGQSFRGVLPRSRNLFLKLVLRNDEGALAEHHLVYLTDYPTVRKHQSYKPKNSPYS